MTRRKMTPSWETAPDVTNNGGDMISDVDVDADDENRTRIP